jgi:hypothetical protein
MQCTYIGDLSIVRSPTFDQGPRLILLVPDLEAVVGARGHHARAKVVEVNGKHKVLVAMGEGLETAFRCHLCVRVTCSSEMQLELLYDAVVDNGWATIRARLLDQRRDKVSVFQHIFKGNGKVEMGVPVMGERTRVQPCFVACGA